MALKRSLETKEVLVPEEVTCNKCGRSCPMEHGHTEEIAFVEVKQFWGGNSSKDDEAHRFHLCEPCYDAVVSSFAVPVEIRGYCAFDFHDPFDPEVELRRLRWGRDPAKSFAKLSEDFKDD